MKPSLALHLCIVVCLVPVGCSKSERDIDAIRRAVVLNELAMFAATPRKAQPTFCLAVRDRFDGGTAGSLMNAHQGGLQDPPPGFVDGFWREELLQGAKLLSLSECSGWFDSPFREATSLLLVENLSLHDASHATVEVETRRGDYGTVTLYKLEKQGNGWKIIDEQVVVEG